MVWRKRRYACRGCGRSFTESHPELPARQRAQAYYAGTVSVESPGSENAAMRSVGAANSTVVHRGASAATSDHCAARSPRQHAPTPHPSDIAIPPDRFHRHPNQRHAERRARSPPRVRRLAGSVRRAPKNRRWTDLTASKGRGQRRCQAAREPITGQRRGERKGATLAPLRGAWHAGEHALMCGNAGSDQRGTQFRAACAAGVRRRKQQPARGAMPRSAPVAARGPLKCGG